MSGENTFILDNAFQLLDEISTSRKVMHDIENEKMITKKTPHYAMIYEN